MRNPESTNKVESSGRRPLTSTSDLHIHIYTYAPITLTHKHPHTCKRTETRAGTPHEYHMQKDKKERAFYWLCGSSRGIWLYSDAWGNSPVSFLPLSLSLTGRWSVCMCDFTMQSRKHWVQLRNVILPATGTPFSWGVTHTLTEWSKGTLRSFQNWLWKLSRLFYLYL